MRLSISIVASCLLLGCANTQQQSQEQFEEVPVGTSYLQKEQGQASDGEPTVKVENAEVVDKTKYRELAPLSSGYELAEAKALENNFSSNNTLAVASDKMPVGDFLHYALGEQLGLNYVLANDLPLSSAPVTLNIKDNMSSRQFFSLIQDVLQQRQMTITENNNIYYVVKSEASTKGNVAIGVGAKKSDIPNAATQIMQIIPTRFGISTTLERTLVSMIDATVEADFQQNVLFVQGRRPEIVRAVELVALLDKPLNRGKQVGVIDLTFISADEFIQQTRQLLVNEGVSVGVGFGNGENVVFVPLAQIGSVAIFSSDPTLVQRVQFWGQQLDKPATKSESQYFMYTPRFARASDLGDSLSPLLGQQGQQSQQRSTNSNTQARTQNNQSTAVQSPSSRNRAVNQTVKGLTMVVDERSNSLIFYGAGSEYQSILPLVRKLDVLPKQIILDVNVVEVTLQGVFRQGVEFAIRSQSSDEKINRALGTLGAFGVADFGGLSYIYDSVNLDVAANLFRNNNLVNIVSNPTLVVRDGVTASMSVGNDIPITSATTQGSAIDVRTTQQFSYRKTGLELDVKPTVNAQNFVLMEISQQLSNAGEGGQGNPPIFERTLKTEVVAKSGQTILLGGIISENNRENDNNVPGISSIPILGSLFESKSTSSDKTELVVMITARVLDNTEEWEQIMRQFEGGLQSIKIDN